MDFKRWTLVLYILMCTFAWMILEISEFMSGLQNKPPMRFKAKLLGIFIFPWYVISYFFCLLFRTYIRGPKK